MGEFDLSLLESSRNSTQEYQAALNFYNKMIARSILIPDRLFAEGETGAYAQSKIHFDVFLWVVEKLRQDIEEIVMKEQLVRRLINYNFKNVKKLPSFKFNPLTDEQKLALNGMFIDAVSKGVITKNDEDENYIRESLNFPLAKKPVEKEDKETPDPIEEVETEEVETEEVEVEEKEEEVTTEQKDNAISDKLFSIVEEQKNLLKEFITKKFAKGELTIKFIKSGIDLKKKQAIKDEVKKDSDNIDDGQAALIDIKIENYFDQHLANVYIHLIDSVTQNNEIDNILNGIDEIYESDYIENLELLRV